jgi:hypothetical protein
MPRLKTWRICHCAAVPPERMAEQVTHTPAQNTRLLLIRRQSCKPALSKHARMTSGLRRSRWIANPNS